MANKKEIFNSLVESKILSEDVNISDYTKNELLGMYKNKETVSKQEVIVEKGVPVEEVIPEETVVEKEVPVEEVIPKETVVEKEVPVEEVIPKETVVEKEVTTFSLGDNFKPLYRINAYRSGTDPVIKVSSDVYQYIKSQIHVNDICDTPVEKQLKSIVYHIRTQPNRYITVTSMPNEIIRCSLVNGVLMSQTINE